MAALALTLAYLVFNRFPGWQTFGTVVVALVALLAPLLRRRCAPAAPDSRADRLGRWLRKPAPLIVIPSLVAFIATASLALHRGLPLPYVHDEASYLLAADTFAHGRLTNPSPAVPEPFETMHALVSPSYQSKYPPAQGLFMALGQVIFGHPIWGVWISGALAVAASTWALRAIVPAPWALVGGLILAIHPQMLEWGQRYWGGYPGVLGGGLLLGAVIRLGRRPRVRDGILMAIGLLILAMSRPFEGLLLAGLLIVPLLLRRPPLKPLLAAVAVLAIGLAWMGYYNHHVTGHPLRLPYQEHQAQYGAAPLFIFQPRPAPPAYHHPELARFYGQDQVYNHLRRESAVALLKEALNGIHGLWLTWFGNASVLAIGLLMLPAVLLQSAKARRLTITLILFCAGLLTLTYLFGHYAAPAAALVCGLTVLLLRRLWQYGLGRPLVRMALAVFALWALFWWIGFFGWRQDPASFQARRARVEQELMQHSGRHLVLVRYSPRHNVHEEWVYNGADLERRPVIWAREMAGSVQQQALLKHYEDRTIWLLEPDSQEKPYLYKP